MSSQYHIRGLKRKRRIIENEPERKAVIDKVELEENLLTGKALIKRMAQEFLEDQLSSSGSQLREYSSLSCSYYRF